MKNKLLLFFPLILILILNACSPFTITSSSGEQPTPEIEPVPVTGYQPVDVVQVEAQVGVGSPIPVHVLVSGNLPDTCAQIEYVEQKQVGTNFQIKLFAAPSNAEDCTLARDTLPFRIMIPLNVVNLPAGTYSVDVNGSRANFDLNTGNTSSSQPAADSSLTKDDIPVDEVNVEVGVGSPIPVHAIVSLSLPNTCAQLGEIRLQRDGTKFYVRLIAEIAERADCKTDSIPFRLEIPLNIVNLPEGPYEVNVNGVTANFDPRAKPAGNPQEQACTAPVDVSAANRNVSYNGISFKVDPAIADSVSAQICPEKPSSEQQMVNEAHPPYTQFFFPTYDRQNVDFQPEIRVYEVTGDLQSYLFPLNELDDLKAVIEQRPEPVTWFQHSPLHTRQAYLDFASGAGVRGLVQYMQDFFFFTNNGLMYEFHGLTQDGRHFISVRYPVSVPFLMELEGVALPPVNVNPQSIAISGWPSDFEEQRQVIEAYNTEALGHFEQMSDSDALPNLGLLDAVVQSIQVSQP